MIFQPELCAAILSRRKTQTRRLVRPTDMVLLADGSMVHWKDAEPDEPVIAVYRNRRLLWMVGRTYAVQPGRGRRSVARVRLRRIRRERLQDISPDDVRAEGIVPSCPACDGERTSAPCVCAEHFRRVWDGIHDRRGGRWGDNPWVWVLGFEPTDEHTSSGGGPIRGMEGGIGEETRGRK